MLIIMIIAITTTSQVEIIALIITIKTPSPQIPVGAITIIIKIIMLIIMLIIIIIIITWLILNKIEYGLKAEELEGIFRESNLNRIS